MVTLGALWLPIVVSAVILFVASALMWMVVGHHRSDFKGVTDEPALREALRKQGLVPGSYLLPFTMDPAKRESPEMKKMFEEGPIVWLTVVPPGYRGMGPMLIKQFIFFLVVSYFVAYVTGRVIPPAADYLHVFRIAGATAMMAYSFGHIPSSIWFGRPWSITVKDFIDGVVYGLLTAGTFGWLWPKM
jgi:hypothetical protein